MSVIHFSSSQSEGSNRFLKITVDGSSASRWIRFNSNPIRIMCIIRSDDTNYQTSGYELEDSIKMCVIDDNKLTPFGYVGGCFAARYLQNGYYLVSYLITRVKAGQVLIDEDSLDRTTDPFWGFWYSTFYNFGWEFNPDRRYVLWLPTYNYSYAYTYYVLPDALVPSTLEWLDRVCTIQPGYFPVSQ